MWLVFSLWLGVIGPESVLGISGCITFIMKQMSFSNLVTGITEKARTADEIENSSCGWLVFCVYFLVAMIGSSDPHAFPALTRWSCYDNRKSSHLGVIDSATL